MGRRLSRRNAFSFRHGQRPLEAESGGFVTGPGPLRAEHFIEVPRTARYYTIGDTTRASTELWFVLHGFSQLAGNFVQYFADLATTGSRLVVAPEGLNRFYVNQDTSVPAKDRPVGATWMTREDRLNEIRDYVRYFDRLHTAI